MNSYDRVPYELRVFPQTHPDRLATIARLFGMTPQPVTRCRVLELGCGGGANLVPMAFHLPASEFVGVDLSERHVRTARASIDGLALDNVRVEHADIRAIDESWGTFDYIVCHGVFSWVADDVKRKILDVAARTLAPHGILYVSYNTYPGWHDSDKMRVMMLFHAGASGEPERRIEQARAMVDFLAESVPATDAPYRRWLDETRRTLRERDDSYLFHEYLEPVNEPLYFSQFVERAAEHGLQYLGEADFTKMFPREFPAQTATRLQAMAPDVIRFEQYLDFLRNRRFRQTLLCRQDVTVDRRLDPERVSELLVSSDVTAVDRPVDLAAGKRQAFQRPQSGKLHTDIPLIKAMLATLEAHAPCAVPLDALMDGILLRLSTTFDPLSVDKARSRASVQSHLVTFYAQGAVDLHTWQPDCTPRVSERPRVSRMAAHQAAHGDWVVTQSHTIVRNLGAGRRQLIQLLDGTRDRALLVASLAALVKDGALTEWDGAPGVIDRDRLVELIERDLDGILSAMARSALLIA